MKRKLVAMLLLALLCCFRLPHGMYPGKITQQRVCTGQIDMDEYAFSAVATDTGIVIPGLAECFVPQGLAWWEAQRCFVLSGYFRPSIEEAGSALMLVDADGRLLKTVTVEDEKGVLCSGHFSGVAISSGYLYVADGGRVHCIPLTELGKERVRTERTLIPCMKASACTYHDGVLWVCSYEVGRQGVMVGYHTASMSPVAMIKIPDKVQGVCIGEGSILFSRSYGRRNASYLSAFSDPRSRSPDAVVVMENKKIPLWDLDEEDLRWSASAPPMSEGCCTADGKVYLIFESAAYFYRAFDPDNTSKDPTDTLWRIERPLTDR